MNLEKKEVHIYALDKDNNWKISFTFPEGEIEHIHNIIQMKQKFIMDIGVILITLQVYGLLKIFNVSSFERKTRL